MGIYHDIGSALDSFGGFLRCESCGTRRELNAGDAGRFTVTGWPKHCGYTMRWWTQNEIDKGEVAPVLRESKG